MPVSISQVTSTLQKVIMPYIQDNLPSQTILLDKIRGNSDVQVMNDNFYAPIRTSRHGGIVALASDTSNTRSGQSSRSQASVGVKILTGQFEITKLAIDATRSNQLAVENELMEQADTLVRDFSRDVNRQLYGDGYGIIGQVLGSIGAGTMAVGVVTSSVDDARGTADYFGSINGDIAPGQYIYPGMVLGIGTGGADAGTVTSITRAAGSATVVMTGAPAIVADDAVYTLDGSEAGAGTSELTGITSALSFNASGTYAGIARTASELWQPQTDSTLEALTLSRMQRKYLAARQYGANSDTYIILVNQALYSKYGDLLTAMRRTVNEMELAGGWTGLSFEVGAGKVGVFLDYQVPDGEVLILNLDTWKLCQVSDINWMENPTGDGGSLLRVVNSIKYQATMHWFVNLLNVAPAANARLAKKQG